MNPNADELELARWLDGEMSAAEQAAFDLKLQSDATLRAEADMLQSLRTALQTAIPRQTEVPHADFFNSQVQERIAQLRQAEQPQRKASAQGWLRLPWLAFAAAACLLLTITLWNRTESAGTVVLNTYAPNNGVQATTFHSGDANATVLKLEGLEAIPNDRKLVGFQVHHSETDQEVAMTTLYSETGDVLMVLAKDARNQPRMLVH